MTACGSCPLAGMCEKPSPAPGSSYFRMFDAPAHDPDPPADIPDRDPNEPRPDGAGCCGGSC